MVAPSAAHPEMKNTQLNSNEVQQANTKNPLESMVCTLNCAGIKHVLCVSACVLDYLMQKLYSDS